MNYYKQEKAQLIKDGKYEDYKQKKKECFNAGYDISNNPTDLNLSEFELDLILRLEKSTKRKKQDFRRHAYFMGIYYDNIGLLTLSYSDRALDISNLETKKQQLTQILKKCFCDYIGKFEISPNGRLHFHAIVAWNGEVKTIPTFRENHKNDLVVNKHDLQKLWYGEKDSTGQPTKYGVYDLILIPDTKQDKDKATNYSMKSLNTMESYIQKDEQIDLSNLIDEELIYAVNTSNILTARNTPYQAFKKAQDKQDRELKRTCRTFDNSFYEQHKFKSKKHFREWAEANIHTNISLKPGTHKDLFGNDFKIVKETDF